MKVLLKSVLAGLLGAVALLALSFVFLFIGQRTNMAVSMFLLIFLGLTVCGYVYFREAGRKQ